MGVKIRIFKELYKGFLPSVIVTLKDDNEIFAVCNDNGNLYRQKLEEGMDIPRLGTMQDEDCQSLIDMLYECGYRPSLQKQEMREDIKLHLNDMRKIVSKKLDIDL